MLGERNCSIRSYKFNGETDISGKITDIVSKIPKWKEPKDLWEYEIKYV